MRKFISGFLKEHEHGMVHLNFIRDAIARINTSGINKEDIRMLDDSVSFVANDVLQHCKNEESTLYPKLRRIISQNNIDELKNEHKKILSAVEQVKNLILQLSSPDFANGKSDELKIQLTSNTNILINLLSSHILEENKMLFSIAEKQLSETDINNLFKTTRKGKSNETV